MNAAVPPGWRPSFTAKQRRSIGSGAWACGRKRWSLFRVSSTSTSTFTSSPTSTSSSPSSPFFPDIRSLFFFPTVLWGRTLICLWGQLAALFCACFSKSGLPALRPARHRNIIVITRLFYWSTSRLAALRCAAGFCFASITQRSGIAGVVECM